MNTTPAKITVIYHSADYDGISCREIAKKFLGENDVEYIGWNFGDPPVCGPAYGHMDRKFVVMDLPLDKPFSLDFKDGWACNGSEHVQPLDRISFDNIIWIDHHKSSIESHPKDIPGYRIDGVAACRLAWQWFQLHHNWDPREQHPPYDLPSKQGFIDRKVQEPLAVRLAGEYDIWDKRDPRAETFQYALRASDVDWELLLKPGTRETLPSGTVQWLEGSDAYVEQLLQAGMAVQRYAQNVDASICNSLTWLMEWDGLKFLCVNHARFNSLLFAAKDVPETGHDALLGFKFDGKQWTVSLYHAKHRTDLDLSEIAKKHGGGGHCGACGFTCKTLPFPL